MDENALRRDMRKLNWEEAFVLFYYCSPDNLSMRQIAGKLGKSQGTAWGRRRTGIGKLGVEGDDLDNPTKVTLFNLISEVTSQQAPSAANWKPAPAATTEQTSAAIEGVPDTPQSDQQPARRWPVLLGLLVLLVLVSAGAVPLFSFLSGQTDSTTETPEPQTVVAGGTATTPPQTARPSVTPEVIDTQATIDAAVIGTVDAQRATELAALPAVEPTTPHPASPTNTPEPSATSTPPIPTNTPTPAITLPFIDTFDLALRPEWQVIQGTPLISQGRLTESTGTLTIQLDTNLPNNYTVSFDYEIGGFSSYLTFGDELRYELDCCAWSWEILVDGSWEVLVFESNPDMPAFTNLRIQVTSNFYQMYFDSVKVHEFAYGEFISGPLSITLRDDYYIDNFQITIP